MKRLMIVLAVLWLIVPNLRAQEYRATLLGIVTDQSGASIPNSEVIVTNTATGVVTRSQSNADGTYVVPFLNPGTYGLEVRKDGFKTFEQNPIELQVDARVRIDVRLELGQTTQTVNVVSRAPLLQTASGSRGAVIGQQQITALPVNSRNPLTLIKLAPGVQYQGGLIYFRPYDNGSENDYSINGGGKSQNTFLLDGLPDNALTYYSVRPQVSYVAPLEAVQEMKIQANSYDAEFGHTSGGVISMSTKSGTNTLHGAVYEYLRRGWLGQANTFSNNANRKPLTADIMDQYGFEVGGPVTIPKVYNGKDRTFFMFALERYHEPAPHPGLGSVPTTAQRGGDFSQTFNAAGKLLTIYDPLTTRPNPSFDSTKPVSLSNPEYIRDPFPGNMIPTDRLNPIALQVLGDIPPPNQSGDSVTQLNNWYAGNVQSLDDFQNLIARVDHNVSGNWKIFGRWEHNFRNGGRHNDYDWQTNARQFTHSYRRNDGAGFDVVGTLNSQTVFTGRIGFNRFVYGSIYTPEDLSYLGLPVTNQLQLPGKYPLFQFTNYIGTGVNLNDTSPFEAYDANATLVKIVGRHSLKFGVDYMLQHLADIGFQNGSGTYSFTPSWTSSQPQIADPNSGNAIASFLLGDMNSASVNLNATPYLSWHNFAWFLQDDWQVNSRLSLNLGLRWDYTSPPYERYNSQLRGFDFTAPNPYQVPSLNLKGGLLFAGVNGQPRGAWSPDYADWQPRLGLAYRVLTSHPLVFRAGVGRYFAPLNYIFGENAGFAQTTTSQTTTADFLPFDTLSNPFPGGLIQPVGASLGLASQVGNAAEFTDPNWKNWNTWQFSVGFQYQPKSNLLLELSYVGSRTKGLGVSKQYDYLTLDQLALGTASLNAKVPNPFFGVLPARTSLGAQSTIQERSLLTQYPEFTSVLEDNMSIGLSWYNSLQAGIEQRLEHGLTLHAFYTFSKTMEAVDYLNPQDVALGRELVSFDIPHTFVFGGTYELPFGRGRAWLSGGGLLTHVASGWQIDCTGLIESGTPMVNPSGYYIFGNPKLSSGQNLNHWFNTSSQIWVPMPVDALRDTPLNNSTVRLPSTAQSDATIMRTFSIKERNKLQFRLEAYNFTNTPVFGAPNTTPSSPLFGVVPTVQTNIPRSLELGLRYSF
jgi:Carboxypeptidase regulatory-like domain